MHARSLDLPQADELLEAPLNNTLLQVKNLSVGFMRGSEVTAITEGVNFSVGEGESYALVGESGCGKSITALAIMGLLPRPSARILSGEAIYAGIDLLRLDAQQMSQYRGSQLGFIFQEPGAALNPVRTIGSQLRETRIPLGCDGENRIREGLLRTGITDPERVLKAFPHELSGGMLQRVVIAQALLPGPRLLIADEPTTALDVTVQAQVMEILHDLCSRDKVALLLITHNLGLVFHYAKRLGVMYAGHLVEQGPVHEVLHKPWHPYTRGLLEAMPLPGRSLQNLRPIPGRVPLSGEYGVGCRFASRCKIVMEQCSVLPKLREHSGRSALCHIAGTIHE